MKRDEQVPDQFERTPRDGLEARIRHHVEAMPPSERSVAELVLAHPGLLATHSATELAGLAGSSKAAVTRCIRRIGYASFAAVRAEARGAQRWGSPLYAETGLTRVAPPAESRPRGARARGAKGARLQDERLAAHVRAEVVNLDRSFAAIGQQRFEAIAQAIAGARRVLVLGYRNSRVLATHLAAMLGALRTGVELAPGAAGTLGESLASLSRHDVVVAVGLRRRVPVFMRAIRVAQAQGARVLYLTDAAAGTHASQPTWTMRVHCAGTSLFDSYAAAFSVANYLLALVAARCGEPARARLREIERLHGALDELA
ncbi:MAG: MurR/RpiR family transcriptional regulator [Burkholderiales bacterium]|nr:MAG: MurR/RpiR family transcriptional regulator [Burkholderiales bacterium]